jgi:hypothetical protein
LLTRTLYIPKYQRWNSVQPVALAAGFLRCPHSQSKTGVNALMPNCNPGRVSGPGRARDGSRVPRARPAGAASPTGSAARTLSTDKEGAMTRTILALAVSSALSATPAPACIGPAAPYLDALAASNLPHETIEGEVMARALAALHQRLDFDEQPTRVAILFGDRRAALWLIVGSELCNVIYGPIEGVREILRSARGAPV